MAWHDDAQKRHELGIPAEEEWVDTFRCHCGGRFLLINTMGYDATCENCGQLVDIKTSPDTEKWGNITISQIPFDNYPDDLLLTVKRANGLWVCAYRQGLMAEGPYPPTHSERATWFYKVSLEQFVAPENLGYQRI